MSNTIYTDLEGNNKPAEPSSSLHTKLQTILDQFTVKPIPNNKYYRLGQDHIIAQILQAFQESGYIKVTATQEQQAALANMTLGNTVMTGQEFYARFKAELDKLQRVWKYTDDLTYDMLYDAGKRAAGVSDE